MRKRIAALFVQPAGCYAGLPGVDPWPESRDATRYHGPHPVVAHPPCTRWCRLAGLVEARHGYIRGEDGGLFASALAAVRRWGGVLEHPAHSAAWAAHGLLAPPRGGGWVRAEPLGDAQYGWTCHVYQGHYGHRAAKGTWLYAVRTTLPRLMWGAITGRAQVSWCQSRSGDDDRPCLSRREASATPDEFRDILIEMARSVYKCESE